MLQKHLVYTSRHIITAGLLSTVIALSACGGGGSGGNNSGTPLSGPQNPAGAGTLTGQINDGANGIALSPVSVRAAGQATTSQSGGNYTLTGLTPGDRTIVTFSLPGYTEQSRVVRIQGQGISTNLPVLMLPIALSTNFDPDTPQTLTVNGSPASVVLPASSLKKADGSAPTGQVTAEITPIDPATDIDLMPGEMKTDTGGGVLAPIESFGALNVTFRDSAGNDLNLAQGTNATIRIPVSNKTGSTPPATIPLYFYDKTQGLWVREGSATLDASNSYYEGTVSHFSTWNADILYQQVQVTGCVEDSTGTRLSGVQIISEGKNYSGTDSTFTDAAGNFSVAAKPNASVLIVGLRNGIKTNTVPLTTTTSDFAMNSCLILSTGTSSGNVAASVKLSWGNQPLDLDAHYIGPAGSNIHVYFVDRGDLGNFPFANLDVDDLDSFGPEVTTIFKFPQAGTYRYSVHNFSRLLDSTAASITASPAVVELNVNSNITLFTPPPGEGSNETWDVFDFVVAADGSFTISPVNKWSATQPDPTNLGTGNTGTTPGTGTPPPAGGGQTTVLEGRWRTGCVDSDPVNNPGQLYNKAEITFTGNTVVSVSDLFTDSNCTIAATVPLFTGNRLILTQTFTVGSGVTTSGGFPATQIDFTTVGQTDGNGNPLTINSIGEIDYDIFYIDSNRQLFFGDDENGQFDGTSPASRPRKLDFLIPASKI